MSHQANGANGSLIISDVTIQRLIRPTVKRCIFLPSMSREKVEI
jgi:hypothetical protein